MGERELTGMEMREIEAANLRKSIKPCPFCGGRGFLEGSSRAFVNGESTRVAFVRCLQCNARGGRVNIADFGTNSRSIDAEREAVAKWNRRNGNV